MHITYLTGSNWNVQRQAHCAGWSVRACEEFAEMSALIEYIATKALATTPLTAPQVYEALQQAWISTTDHQLTLELMSIMQEKPEDCQSQKRIQTPKIGPPKRSQRIFTGTDLSNTGSPIGSLNPRQDSGCRCVTRALVRGCTLTHDGTVVCQHVQMHSLRASQEINLERITNIKHILAKHYLSHLQGPSTKTLIEDLEADTFAIFIKQLECDVKCVRIYMRKMETRERELYWAELDRSSRLLAARASVLGPWLRAHGAGHKAKTRQKLPPDPKNKGPLGTNRPDSYDTQSTAAV